MRERPKGGLPGRNGGDASIPQQALIAALRMGEQ